MSKKFEIGKKRVVGFIGHGSSGKTSIGDAILYITGNSDRLGKIDDGTSVLDYETEEHEIKHTIIPGFYDFVWNDNLIQIIDLPGYSDLVHEAKNGLQAVGGAVLVVHAVDGVRVQTEQVIGFAREQNVPMIAFVNALDKEHADFNKILKEMAEAGLKPLPMFVPIGKEAGLKGVVDVMNGKAYYYDMDGSGKVKSEGAVPADMADEVASLKESASETLVEAVDEIMEKYLDGQAVSEEELKKCLREGVRKGTFTPVYCGAALHNVGIRQLFDGVVNCLPSPDEEHARKAINPSSGEEIMVEMAGCDGLPLKAIVFKTLTDPYTGRISIFRVFHGKIASDDTVNVFGKDGKQTKERFGKLAKIRGKKQESFDEIYAGEIGCVAKLKETMSGDTLAAGAPLLFDVPAPITPNFSVAVYPKAKGDEEKIGLGLAKMLEEDNGLVTKREPQTKELLLYGMGQQHLDITFHRIKRLYNVEVQSKIPLIPYRETIKKSVKNVEGKHKKQSGGRGQFGVCVINMYPNPREAGFEFLDMIVGGAIPNQFIPAVEKGIREAMECGPLSGSPVQDIKIELIDGKYHPVDSSEYSFKVAGSLAFKEAFDRCEPALLEPVMKIEVLVPEENMGDIIGDLNGRRGRVLGMEAKGRYQCITAEVPLSEIRSYGPTLKSITGDRGSYALTFDHYDEVPSHMVEKIIAELKKMKEEAS